MKVVINKCYGGFGLSYAGVMRYAEIKGITLYPYIGDIHKQVYGDRAVIGNKDIPHGYSTQPVENEDAVWENGTDWDSRDISRADSALVQVVEEMGEDSFGRHAELNVVEIPDDVDYEIEEYDGMEWVAEKHRTWG